MRKILAAAFALVLANTVAQERITDFRSDIEVAKSGDLVVTETIRVVAENREINRGIYRDFPTLYQSMAGLKRRVAFDVLEVKRDGRAEPWHSERRSNGVRVYIGDADRTLEPGPHEYELRYRTDRQLVQRPEFDELYWNVTGNAWAFPIERATARVNLPAGARVSEINAYTGPAGSQGRNWEVGGGPGWNALIRTTQPLQPGEGLTLSVKWQKGIVEPHANATTLLDILLDNGGIALAVLGLGLVLFYYAAVWVSIGRDPPRGVIIPLYEPPAGMTPSAVRYVAGMGTFDQKSVASAVLGLAVAGVLRIRQEGKTYTLERTDESPSVLPRRQRVFFDELLAVRKELALTNTQHKVFSAARSALKKELAKEFEKRLFVRNAGWWAGGVALSLVPALISLLDAREIAGALFMLVWLSGWSVGVIALLSAAISSWRSGSFLAAIPTTLFALPFVGGWFFGAFMLVQATSLWIAGVFVIGFVINLVFHHLLKAPTREGRRVMDQIEGFRKYLSVGERDRLNLENPPERTPERFEAFLPFALALDVEQEWSEQFTEVLRAADYQPRWYAGGTPGFYTSPSFGSSLGGAFAGAIASSSSAPGSSSGGGGGGSSGGGGGGGGGGGW